MTKREILRNLDAIIESLDRHLFVNSVKPDYVAFYDVVNDEILRKLLTLRDDLGNSLLCRERL